MNLAGNVAAPPLAAFETLLRARRLPARRPRGFERRALRPVCLRDRGPRARPPRRARAASPRGPPAAPAAPPGRPRLRAGSAPSPPPRRAPPVPPALPSFSFLPPSLRAVFFSAVGGGRGVAPDIP